LSKTEHFRTELSKTEHFRTELSKTEHFRTELSKTEHFSMEFSKNNKFKSTNEFYQQIFTISPRKASNKSPNTALQV